MTDQEYPQGMALTAIDEAFREDPYPILGKLRSEAPVLEDTELSRYVYTRHDDVKAILRDNALWSDPRKARPGTFTREFLGGDMEQEPSMLLMDEPDHNRLRRLVSKPFTPAAVERWREPIKAVVQRVLDSITTDEFDLIEQFAGPIPTVVIAEMLGLNPDDHEQFKTWSDTSVKVAFNPLPDEAERIAGEAANQALVDYFDREIERRRNHLGDDLLSTMIRAEEAGDKLTKTEIISQCNLLLVAGNVTTTDLIGNGVKALLENPEQLEKLRHKPELIKNAVEEMLRYDSPVTNSGRIANREVDFGGCPVHEGETLSTSLAAANRDPDVYPDPDSFDITREDTHHQSFGGGRHLCLGAHLARIEAQEAILGLLDRYPSLRLSNRGHVYASAPSFRGMTEFWVVGRTDT
jgi:cytochrome P450